MTNSNSRYETAKFGLGSSLLRMSGILVVLLACGFAQPLIAQVAQSTSQATVGDATPENANNKLILSGGDLVELLVFDTPELSGKMRIDSDGNVVLPVGGVLHLEGLSAKEAGTSVENRLREKDILKDPHVTVFVDEYATQGVSIMGEVNKPGVYPLLGSHGLLDFVSVAQGLTPNAAKTVTITHRGDPSHPLIVELESKPGSIAKYNPDIKPGDTIVVARGGVVYVVGDVGKPGGFLIENNERLTVLAAVALAQGTNHTALLKSTKLIRKTLTGREELPMPLNRILANKAPDATLEDGDILYVPFSASKNVAYHGILSALQLTTGVAMYRAF